MITMSNLIIKNKEVISHNIWANSCCFYEVIYCSVLVVSVFYFAQLLAIVRVRFTMAVSAWKCISLESTQKIFLSIEKKEINIKLQMMFRFFV